MSKKGKKKQERENNGRVESKANQVQIGGQHYRKMGGEQHWDRLVRLYGIDVAFVYFVGNITAYVERYREKGGIQDLKKARHYIDKLIELEEANRESKVVAPNSE
jgi:hypothetical protein